MYRRFYSEILEDAPQLARANERAVILHSIQLLDRAERAGPKTRQAIEALLFLRRLWEFLLVDLGKSENQLPQKLRADLISVGIGVLRHADAISRGEFERLRVAEGDFSSHSRWAFMMKPFCINLKSGERIFINGAVLRVDRKVSIEFLNDVTFLLEAHVMQAGQTTTPFRQLYFMIQTIVIDPSNASIARRLFDTSYRDMYNAVSRKDLRTALTEVRQLVDAKRYYDALKTLRNCFAIEDEILNRANLAEPA